MEKKLISAFAGIFFMTGLIVPVCCHGQGTRSITRKYLNRVHTEKPAADGNLKNYRMTAEYLNMDMYGNFTGKMKVSGDYTIGFKDGSATWENVFIASSNSESEPFTGGARQDYMEGFRYIPSDKMVEKDAFKGFPSTPENVFCRNLVWDMLTFDTYAWNFSDSLKLNIPYAVVDSKFQFDMADIGKYSHKRILVTWKGISEVDGLLCTVIDFNAINNTIELSIPAVNTKGTEQYWGTVWVSLKTNDIEKGVMYSGSDMEVEVKGMDQKFLMKAVRELYLERIK